MSVFLIWAVGGALLLVGAGAMVAPRFSSSQYGLTPDGPSALGFVQAMGIRDVVLGLMILFTSRAVGGVSIARSLIALVSLVAVGDLAIVLKARGLGGVKNAAIHGVGAVGLAVVWFLLGALG